MSNDSFTEVTSQSWFGRIGDAIKGILFGVVLFAASFVLLFWNEGRAVKTAKALSEGASAVVSIDSGKLDSQNKGKLVHLTGMATTSETLSDSKFGISINALKLRRQVQMYQWQEKKQTEKQKKFGGGEETITRYSYALGWSDNAVDSSQFKEPQGHANPPKSLNDLSQVAQTVTISDFHLSPALVGQIATSEPLQPPTGKPAGLGSDFQQTPSGYYRGADPANPQLGDLKIDFSIVRPQTVSIIAQQSGNNLQGYLTKVGRTLEMLTVGPHSAEEMFQSAKDQNSMLTWILRLVGLLVMWFGLSMVFKPMAILADVVPFIGDLVGAGIGFVTLLIALPLSFITIAVAWFFYRPLLSISLLALAGGAVYLLMQRMKKAKLLAAAATPQPAITTPG